MSVAAFARRLSTFLPAAVAVAGLAALAFVLFEPLGLVLEKRVPGTDRLGQAPEQIEVVSLVGSLERFPEIPHPEEPRGSWSRFRGPDLDNINREAVPLARSWPPEGPPLLWAIDLGEGYAAAAVLGGRVYVMDYDRTRQSDVLQCLSLVDGADIWRYSYRVTVKRNHGMSRTVPTVTDKYVVAMGPKCHVTCLDAQTGDRKWSIDLVREWGSKVPRWYAGQCPLIDGDRTILAPGGTALLMAVESETGKVIWQTPNPRVWLMTHTSIVPMEFKGRRTYVYCASEGVVGVSADDGTLLWETTAWQITSATVPTPVIVGEDRIFLTGGYNAGSLMLRLTEENGKIKALPLFRLDAKEFACIQQTPTLFENHIYGVDYDGRLACIDLEGKVAWRSGRDHKFGLGPSIIAGGVIYVMDDAGLLAMAEASPLEFRLLGQARILEGHDAWGPLALAGGRLIARDLTRMVCIDLRRGP